MYLALLKAALEYKLTTLRGILATPEKETGLQNLEEIQDD
jgi:hypothetical protein